MNPYITLHSGHSFHLLKPKPEEFRIKDIAYSLSNICRFTGHTIFFYPVAQHACIVCDWLPKHLKLEGLMHDGTESVYGDVSSPLKALIPQYKEIECYGEKMMAKKFKLVFPFPAEIKLIDMRILVTEKKQLMKGTDYKNMPFEPLAQKLEYWGPQKAEREFLKRYHKYKRN